MNSITISDALAQVTENGIGLGNIFNKFKVDIDSYENYMAKANAVGLSDEYKDRVHNGALDIESITDENLKEAIKNYINHHKREHTQRICDFEQWK